ncbi:MAG: presenilin family intramembrane aspartyl protease [Candidatus Diapherotrites archaeon]
MNRKLILSLAALFIVTQLIGLWTANFFIAEEVTVTFISEDPGDPINSIYLIAVVLGGALFWIIVIRFFPEKWLYYVFKALESFIIFITSALLFSTFYDSLLVVPLSLLIVLLRIVFAKHIWLRNATSIISTAVVGALLGVSLGIIPVIIFMILLSVYDFIAVFKTKHMVKMAKAISSKNLSFTYAIPTKEHTFELGTGDMVIPLVFSASLLGAAKLNPALEFPLYFIPPVVILIASLIGLLWTINFVSKRVGTALPALPPQTILMLLAFVVLKLVGF